MSNLQMPISDSQLYQNSFCSELGIVRTNKKYNHADYYIWCPMSRLTLPWMQKIVDLVMKKIYSHVGCQLNFNILRMTTFQYKQPPLID